MNMKNLRYALLLLVLTIFPVSYSYSQTCPAGMVAYWKLEETSGKILEDAFGTNDASTDVTLGSEAGKVGNAVIIDSNTVDIPSSTAFNFGANTSFSIEFWIKYTDVTSGQYDHVVIGRGDYYVPGIYWSIGVEKTSGKIYFDLRDANGSGSNNFQSIISPVGYNNGAWHHIVVVRDESGNKNILYVDGASVASATYDYPGSFSSSAYISVGYLLRSGAPQYFYWGSLDELAIYNRALAPADVNDHYSKGNLSIGYCDGYNPSIITIPNTKATVGSPYTYTVHATGLQSGMTYSLVTKPTGMSINATTGVISWTPSSINVDGYVQVRANNGIVPADTQSYRIFLAEAPVCPSNLLLLLKLDETSGPTYLDFYGSHNGTALVAPAPTTGKINGGQTFNASTKIDIPDNASEFDWSSSASFSFEFWAKSTSGNDMVCVARNRIDYANTAMWWAGISGGMAAFELRDNGGNFLGVYGTSIITDGNWHHIVAVRDGSARLNKLFVDGEEEASDSKTYPNSFIADDPTEVNVGYMHRAGSGDPEYHYIGSMDELAIYDRAVTLSEAAASYNGGNPTGHCALGNYAPVITSTPITAATEDAVYSYTFITDDTDPADVLTLSAVTKPSWLSFNWTAGQKTAILTGTPINENVGNHNVTLRVTDGHIQRDQSFIIAVENVNDSPVVTSTPQTSVNEDEAYSYTLTVTDVDVPDVINMTVITKPSWLNFSYTSGAKTAVLSGTPGNSDTGVSNVDITISDGTETIHHTYALTVVAVNDPPIITAQSTLSTDEDVAITLQKANFTITDIDNPATDLILKIVSGDNYTFAGTVVTPSSNYSGVLTVNVVVSDLNDESEVFGAQITVNALNDPPEITSTPDETVYIGNLYAYVFTATDPDDAPLTKSAVQIPDWLAFSASTGVLTGTPTQANVGQHLIILRVSDGKVDVDQDFILTVQGPEGLNDLEAAGIRIYPVPAKEYLDMQFESLTENTQLEVINSTGSVVRKVTIPGRSDNYRLDLKDIGNGTYYLHVTSSKLNHFGRIVVLK